MYWRLKKLFCDITNRPFLEAKIVLNKDDSADVVANHNKTFIRSLVDDYRDVPEFQSLRSDDERVAWYLYEVLYAIASPLLPEIEGDEDEPNDPFRNVPPLAFRGGVENKQVVDLAATSDNPDLRGVNFRG